MEKVVLVTGSSGFIGSVLVEGLLSEGYKVIGIDLIKSNIKHENFTWYVLDITDEKQLNCEILTDLDIYCVCHLAAKIRVDESMREPDLYYIHNVTGTINILNWCKKRNIRNILFASTAAVYGNPLKEINHGYTEEEAGNPLSVYGRNKLMCEQIICDYGFSGYIFRFFNVCGGSELNHGTPIHLLPLVVNNIIHGKDISIFGDTYKTKDGTCVRDYIHLNDISRAFIMCIKNGFRSDKIKIYNLGSGEGYTVQEIIDKMLEIFDRLHPGYTDKIKVIKHDRRPGDFDTLIANSDLIKNELNWKVEYGLEEMITDTIKSFFD